MLVRFVASNFLSLKEEVEFNMLTGSFKTHKHHVYQAGKVEVLKAAAIYGANGAGKSNLVKAIGFLKQLVEEGAITTSVNNKKFKLDPEYQQKSVRFEIEFYTNQKLYAYGVSIDDTTVLEEWLYELGVAREDKLIFERTVDKQGKFNLKFAKKYQKTQKQKLLIELLEEHLLKDNQLLLSKNEELNIDEITAARRWVTYGYRVMYPMSEEGEIILNMVSSESGKLFANQMLEALNTGVNSVSIEEHELDSFSDIDSQTKQRAIQIINGRNDYHAHKVTKGGPVYITYKKGKYIVQKLVLNHGETTVKSVPFYLSEESDGTRKLLDYISPTYMITNRPVTIIIDEIDQSIHPSLLKKLLQKLMDDEDTKGQLIFTTHESNLLDLAIFRQDEIWFAEKENATGATQFYSLSEFKPNDDLDIEKGYLNGRFGAIPFLADLEKLNWHQHAETE